ncbi:hypothetical protein CN481_15795 [Bacillus sp. AFS006103]|nr:hypothetical protein CN481_15795 [Bacillus sp. AFS006103]
MRKKLQSFGYKTISLDQLTKLADNIDYTDLVYKINTYVEEDLLEPVKASGKNGRRPSLYLKYRIFKPEIDYANTLEEIKLLHPKFNHSNYAKNPEIYLKNKIEIDYLSKFFWENENLLIEPMSINERSFQIWGIEKLLKEKSTIKSIFQYNDWDIAALNYYETPEPFFEYNYSNENEMNILIIENKDTWFSLRKIMREDGLNHLFRNYHTLLYGEGKKIISRNNRLQEYDQLLNGSTNTYYYFGDLDFEGIEIYQTLLSSNQDLSIHLCTELYSLMLEEAQKYNLPKTKSGQKKTDIQEFLKYFNNTKAEEIMNILDNGLYIPQEILNYPLLKTTMGKGATL